MLNCNRFSLKSIGGLDKSKLPFRYRIVLLFLLTVFLTVGSEPVYASNLDTSDESVLPDPVEEDILETENEDIPISEEEIMDDEIPISEEEIVDDEIPISKEEPILSDQDDELLDSDNETNILADETTQLLEFQQTEQIQYTDLDEFLNSPIQLDLYQYHVLKRLEFIQYAFCIVIALLFFNLLRKN